MSNICAFSQPFNLYTNLPRYNVNSAQFPKQNSPKFQNFQDTLIYAEFSQDVNVCLQKYAIQASLWVVRLHLPNHRIYYHPPSCAKTSPNVIPPKEAMTSWERDDLAPRPDFRRPGTEGKCVEWTAQQSGNRITLEHGSQHHFGTQLFLDRFGTQNDTFCLATCRSRHTKHQIYTEAKHFGSFARSKAIPLPKKGANPRLCAYIITSAVMPITTPWPGNSLCSTADQFRVYLGGEVSTSHLQQQPFRVYQGGNFYLHHHFSFLSTVRTDDPAHSEGSYFSLALAILMLTPAI